MAPDPICLEIRPLRNFPDSEGLACGWVDLSKYPNPIVEKTHMYLFIGVQHRTVTDPHASPLETPKVLKG